MKKKWKSLLRLAMPYVIIFFLPVISVLWLGGIVLDNYHEKIVRDKQTNIESSFERLVQKVDTVVDIGYMLAVNDAMEKYSYACLNRSGHTAVDCMEIKALLSNVMVNPVVEEIYLLDVKDNRVISSNTVSSNMDVFFRHAYKIEDYSVEEIEERFVSNRGEYVYSPSMMVNLSNSKKEIIEYRVSLPVGWIRNRQVQLIFAMDTSELFGDFVDLPLEGCEIYVYDNEGNLLYSNGDKYEKLLELTDVSDLKKIDAEDETVYGMVLNSQERSWKMKVYVPGLLETEGIGGMAPYVWGLVVLPVVASVLLSIYFTYKNHKEILGVLEVFRGRSGVQVGLETSAEEVGYKIIREYASRVVQENDRFKEQMTDYEYARRYEVLDKLVRNAYGSRAEIEKALEGTGLQIQDGKHVVLCFRYEDASYRALIAEQVTVKDFIKALLEELIERQYEVFDTSARESVCIMTIESNENMEIVVRDIVSRLSVQIKYYYGIEVVIGAGGLAESVDQLGDSYTQAKEVIKYRETSGNQVSLYSELVKLEDVYYYPREDDEKIYNYIVIGKQEEAKALIRKIYEENFVRSQGNLSVRAMEMLRNRLWDLIVSIAEKYEISLSEQRLENKGNLVSYLHGEKNIKGYFDIIYEVLDLLAGKIEQKRELVQNSSMSKIMNYVHENCCDNTLSLKSLSRMFGFNESYISNLFKIEYGENLSVYIEKLRIEKACHLIKNTDMKITEIAETVGYASGASFRRAFKKVTGVSPVEYREGCS